MTTRIEQMQDRVVRIKKELSALGDMRPGALSMQYNVCGKAGCRCKNAVEPKKHGPYYQLSYTHKGKSTTEFVKKPMVAEARRHLRAYAKFRRLTEEWVDLSLRISKARAKKPNPRSG